MSKTIDTNMMEEESAKSKLHHYVFPTVYENCYRVEVITDGLQLYPTDNDNSTPAIYQLLDNILLDNYADFNGGVQGACAPSVCDGEHHDIEPWEDVSTIFIPSNSTPFLNDNEDEETEEEKVPHTPKDILVSWLVHVLTNKRHGYRLGCVNNRSFNFRRLDGSIHIGMFSQCEEDREIINILDNDYSDSVDQFIDLILESIDKDNENGEFSLYTAANLCVDSTEAERDEFLAIVTPHNQCVIMIGLFYNRFYF